MSHPPTKSSVAHPLPARLSPRMKWIVSGAIAFHVLAVVAEPFQFFTRSQRGVSEASVPFRNLVAPYTEFAYLNHGYFFFAPEPGPSHLMQCELSFEDAEAARLRFPDKSAQWPRLLYHRHFMLAEFLHMMHVEPPPANPSPGLDPELMRPWREARQQFETVRNSMQDHLIKRYKARDARILRIEHRLPSSEEVLEAGMKLDDAQLYLSLPDSQSDALLPERQGSPSQESPGNGSSSSASGDES